MGSWLEHQSSFQLTSKHMLHSNTGSPELFIYEQ